MDNCIFCKIIKNELPSAKIWEDENYYAFFDIFPNCKGQALVIPKEHHSSKIFEMNDIHYSQLMMISKKIAGVLKKAFGVERVGMIVEGMGVDHAHVVLHPMHGITTKWSPRENIKACYFDEYPGFLSSKPGSMLTKDELNQLLKQLTN